MAIMLACTERGAECCGALRAMIAPRRHTPPELSPAPKNHSVSGLAKQVEPVLSGGLPTLRAARSPEQRLDAARAAQPGHT